MAHALMLRLAPRLQAAAAPRLLGIACLGASTAPLAAQDPTPVLDDRSVLVDMFDYDHAGLIGYAIVGLSIVALAIAIENFVALRRTRLAPSPLIDELDQLFDDDNWTGAAEACERDGSYLAHCVAAGLQRLEHPFETIQTAVREAQTAELVKLFQKIGWLSLVSAIAPMLGLFGTVSGMFITFGTIAKAGSVSPAILADGIKMALITTIFGLSVAIPTGVCFFVLKQRVIRLASETNALAEDLFDRFRKAK